MEVIFTEDSYTDLVQIHHYFYNQYSKKKAIDFITGLRDKCLSLQDFPRRGKSILEINEIVGDHYLQIRYKNYKIVYEVNSQIIIYAIIDDIRDFVSLLNQRLLK